MRKYQRQLRAVRELQQMVDEVDRTEPQWRGQPGEGRNRELLVRWKAEVTVSQLFCLP